MGHLDRYNGGWDIIAYPSETDNHSEFIGLVGEHVTLSRRMGCIATGNTNTGTNITLTEGDALAGVVGYLCRDNPVMSGALHLALRKTEPAQTVLTGIMTYRIGAENNPKPIQVDLIRKDI